jgi:positive regulator of sigma E activity
MGKVLALHGNQATIQTYLPRGCASCSCSSPCAVDTGNPHRIVRAHNAAQAAVGQMVRLEVGTPKTRISGPVLVYILPLLGLFAGAFITVAAAPWPNSDVNAALGATLGAGLTFAAIKAYMKIISPLENVRHLVIVDIIQSNR